MENSVIETMLAHRSVRKYTTQKPADEDIHAIVRAAGPVCFAVLQRAALPEEESALRRALVVHYLSGHPQSGDVYGQARLAGDHQ